MEDVIEDVIREYLVAEKRKAKVFIPKIGSISTTYKPAYQGRNMYTGRVVEVPERYSLRFTRAKPSDDDNAPFFAWITARYEANLSVVERRLSELGESIQRELDARRRFKLEEVGDFLLKKRPPRHGRSPSTGEWIEIPARTQLVFVPQQSLLAAIDQETAEDLSFFDKLPNRSFATPKRLSTFSLEHIPPPSQWWKLCQTLAVLEPSRYMAIPSLESGLDYAAMSNGQGDGCKLFFIDRDALILGFGHESPMACWGGAQRPWPGMFEGLADHLRERLFHDYLEAEPVSFCLWYCDDVGQWQKGAITRFPDVPSKDPDGSEYVLSKFPFTAEEYLESKPEADPLLVREVYDHRPLSVAMAHRIDPKVDLSLFARTGYPIERV